MEGQREQFRAGLQRVEEEFRGIYALMRQIETVAEHTDLLALNATVEAAHAGEVGKGFAVVAHEMKELSSRTQALAQDVDVRLETISGAFRQMHEMMQDAGKI